MKNRLIDKLVEECSENIDGNEIIHNNFENVCNSCTVYIVLFVIAFLIIIGVSSVFIIFNKMINLKDFDSSLLKIDKKIIQKYLYLSQ